MKTHHFVFAAALASTVALAQVQVQTGDKTVNVGAGGDLNVKKGGKSVKVKTTGTTTTVEGTTASGETKTLDVQTGGGATTVTDSQGSTVTVDDTGTGPVPTLANGVWTVTGQGRSGTHACGANEEVRISGQGHQLTLTGPCKKVQVSGQSNNVTTDTAEVIQVSGMSNQVSWKAGPGGKKPKVSLSGMGNSAPQLK
ncbi:MAG: DUF3060 domain-containing protein [Myxococcales bacterium]|nr:DUF3060 domain-containing protein [Myxococcales bacterium]